ncbi:hypothetical protein [Rhizobium sp. S163]|uniref:hypothetical protein n=1 Tax=Rhizobium sp. S163 TaxID=3055039 RepID=UPI0025A9DEAF|nr:hypothetical protein [Rhizobium sp. S163]MDM9646063.1 hypothetical protein [Rhizobium sp. S163]
MRNTKRRQGTSKLVQRWAVAVVALASSVAPIIVSAAEAVRKPIDVSRFPGPHNTGIPKGTILTAYDGPCTITKPNTVIDARIVNCPLIVEASGVRITRSQIVRVDVDTADASLTIEDSLADSGAWLGPTIGFSNITVRRSEVRGGQTSVLCSPNCLVEGSWLHGQYLHPGKPQHLGGYMSNGGHDVIVRRNTILCDVEDIGEGGCSGNAQIYGDFAPLARFRFEENYFPATPGGFCTSFGLNPQKPFGSNPTSIVVTGNVWQRGRNGKCGSFGPTTSFDSNGEGNVWSDNVWDDGSALGAR